MASVMNAYRQLEKHKFYCAIRYIARKIKSSLIFIDHLNEMNNRNTFKIRQHVMQAIIFRNLPVICWKN